MKKTLATGGLVVALLTATYAQTTPANLHLPALDRARPPRAEQIYRQLSRSVDAKVASGDFRMQIADQLPISDRTNPAILNRQLISNLRSDI